MAYPFMTLNDNTEITHSELLPNGEVRVYIETPRPYGFDSAECRLPGYTWSAINGYSDERIGEFDAILRRTAHLILDFARDGGILNAAAS